MSEWMVCHKKKAEVPYLLKTIGKSIYTIEELCFYFWQYAQLLGESFQDQSEIQWIREQLGLTALAAELSSLLQKKAEKEELAKAVFQSVHYLSEEELAIYSKNLKKLQNLSPFERNKRKADDLVCNGQYYKALYEYSLLLKEEEAKEEGTASRIYHNMGVASGRMFLFRESAEYFLKAFLAAPDKESLRQYKLAVRLCEEEIEEDVLVQEFPGAGALDIQIYQDMQTILQKKSGKIGEVQKLQQLKNEGKIAEYYRNLTEILQKWQEECRGYMNNR